MPCHPTLLLPSLPLAEMSLSFNKGWKEVSSPLLYFDPALPREGEREDEGGESWIIPRREEAAHAPKEQTTGRDYDEDDEGLDRSAVSERGSPPLHGE